MMEELTRRSVLVVEDERIVAKDLQRTLQGLGYAVPETTATADEAIRIVAERRPDIVLMDIRVKGGQDGIAAAEVIRREFDVPIIYLTAYTDAETVARAKATTPHGYLVKPVKLDELRTAIEIALYRARVEREQRARERWVTTTLNAIADAVIATDSAGIVTFMNPAAEELTELKQGQAIGSPFGATFRIVDRVTGARAEPVVIDITESRVEPSGVDHVLLVTGARDTPIRGKVAPLVDEVGNRIGAVVVLRDVSEQLQLQEQAALSERLGALGTLTAGVAHQVNSPLAAVVANGAYLMQELAVLHTSAHSASAADTLTSQRLRELRLVTAELLQSAERVREVVADLALFSRPPADSSETADVHQALDWAIRNTAGRVRTRARIRTAYGRVPPVAGSELQLRRVFANLLLNAADAMAEGDPANDEIVIETRVDPASRVHIAIRDSGEGMSVGTVRRIFNPFFTTKDAAHGAGLGLAVCHGIVTSLRGEITVDSAEGEGTTFVVVLPAATRSQLKESSRPPALVPQSPRVLVVDDDQLLVRAVRRSLAPLEVTTCLDANEALALLTAAPEFDLVLCDLMMPGLTGMDLYERVLAVSETLARRFVFLSGGPTTDRAARFLASIDNARLEKPFDPASLRRFVERFLQGGDPAAPS
jgi:PAS domain S-box-containing protein